MVLLPDLETPVEIINQRKRGERSLEGVIDHFKLVGRGQLYGGFSMEKQVLTTEEAARFIGYSLNYLYQINPVESFQISYRGEEVAGPGGASD